MVDMAKSDPPKRGPGRPRSAASHRAVLDAAADLLEERGMAGFTVDEVARRCGVSKATIYKHWTGALPIAVEAWGTRVTEALGVPSTGDTRADLSRQAAELAAFYASPSGLVIAQLLARGVEDRDGATTIRERFFAVRRAATVAVIRHGMESGQLRDDIDPELVVDLIFGPIVFRLVNGLTPLTPTEAEMLAAVALRGLAPDRGPTRPARASQPGSRTRPTGGGGEATRPG